MIEDTEFQLVPSNSKELTQELKVKAKVELGEDENTRNQKLRELRNLLKGEENLTFPDDDVFLLQFLRTRKYNLENAFNLCKKYFKCRKVALWRDIKFSVVKQMMERGFVGFLPYRDKDGCLIFYFSAGKWNPQITPQIEFIQMLLITQMNVLQSPATQIAGYKVIGNFEGFGMRHILSCSPTLLWQYMESLQHSLPGRIKAVHIINQSPFFTYLWAILRQAMRKKLTDRFHFHGTDMKELHKRIPPCILPEECGGDLGPFDNTFYKEEMRKFEITFEELMTYGYKVDN